MRSPKNTNKKNLLTDKHYQKFSISIISTSTSRNTNIAFPCKLCNKNINDNDAAIQSDICQFWVHLRCNKLNLVDYKYLQGSADPWFCLSCCSTILTFGNFTDKDLSYLVFIKNYIEISNKNSFDHLKPPPNGALLFLLNLIIPPQSNKLILKMLRILDTLILSKSISRFSIAAFELSHYEPLSGHQCRLHQILCPRVQL